MLLEPETVRGRVAGVGEAIDVVSFPLTVRENKAQETVATTTAATKGVTAGRNLMIEYGNNIPCSSSHCTDSDKVSTIRVSG